MRRVPFGRPAAGGLSRALRAAILGVVAVTASACGRGGSYEITEVRERTDDGPPAPASPLAQRFRIDRPMGGSDPHAGLAGRGMPGLPGAGIGGGDDPHVGGAAPRAPAWVWKTPEGWTELGPAPMRVTAWQAPSGVECSFSTLPAAGGGLAANVDRWRRQMSLEPAGEAGVAALPRHPMLGRDAVRVDLAGTFVGMGGDKSVAGARLLGLVAELPAFTAFLKLTGPAAAVEAETPRFLALAASLAAAPAGAAAGADPAPDKTLSPVAWSAPPEWTRQPARSMRLATFVPAGATTTEIAVSLLKGRAGGTRANLDRWRGQMGGAPLTDAEFQALPRTTILGSTAVLLTADGAYTGMNGDAAGGGAAMAGADGAPAPGTGQRLVGMALERPNDMIFVKMTGPADEVRAEEGRFKAFCESFRE